MRTSCRAPPTAVKTSNPAGVEVFTAAGGARHEVRTFAEEETAYFYLFGVLAAEAIRNGALAPAPAVAAAGLRRGGG